MSTTVFTREEALKRARATKHNVPNTCQLVTRNWLGAPSAGDYDHDGAADAEDGWKSEPAKAKHTDRKPPAGTPVSYGGGSHDNGHRALSDGPDKNGKYWIISTDADGTGNVGRVPLDWPERNWGLKYLGWSTTCDGVPIKPSKPAAAKKAPAKKKPAGKTRGPKLDALLPELRKVKKGPKGSERHTRITNAINELNHVPYLKG